MEWVVLIVVPLLSVGLGAWITYALNVKARQRTYIEELFDRAISAMSVAEWASHYTHSIGRPAHLSDGDYADLLSWLARQSVEDWRTKVADANVALAAVAPYAPPVREYLPYGLDANELRPAQEVIEVLREWRSKPMIDVKPG